MEMVGMMHTCTARRANGQPCSAKARPGRPFCFAHDPELQATRQAARLAGGRNKRTSIRLDRLTPASLRPLLDKFMAAVDAVEAGTLEPKQASAMAALGGVLVRIYETAQLEVALQETQRRLDALERGRVS